MVKVVIQEEETGCGLACVAMLADKSYAQIKTFANSLGIYAEDKNLWYHTDYVRQLLKEYNLYCSEKELPFISWNQLPNLALLATKYHYEEGKPFWHWCVFVRENNQSLVLDPAPYLENNHRRDLNNIAPKWYIEIIKN